MRPTRNSGVAPALIACSPAKPLRYIFLDIDGVICCNYRGELETPKLEQLKRVTDETGAVVVLSTDWRRRADLKLVVERTLQEIGVECVGATPEMSPLSPVRPLEINRWRVEAPEAEAWVAIDDRNLVLEKGGGQLRGHFVLTHFSEGLTPERADRAIRILLKPPSRSASPYRRSAPVAPPEPDRTTPLESFEALLRDADLGHLVSALTHDPLMSSPLTSIFELCQGDRVAFLASLKAKGVGKLGDRQKLANAVCKASRLDRF